jgi:hypothetical protein
LFSNFFSGLLSSWVKIRLHTKNQLYTLPGSDLKVCVVVGGWWWVLTVNLVIDFGLAKPNKICNLVIAKLS